MENEKSLKSIFSCSDQANAVQCCEHWSINTQTKSIGTCSSIKSFIPSKNIIFGFSNTTAPSIQCTNSMVCVYVGTHTKMNRRFFIVFW